MSETEIKYVDNLNDMAWGFSARDSSEALKLAAEALKLAEQINYQMGISQAYHVMAYTYYNISKFDLSIKYYTDAIDIRSNLELTSTGAQKIEARGRKASAIANLGIVYEAKGNYAKALECYLEASKIHEELGDRHAAGKHFNNIGLVYSAQGDQSQALDYFFKAAPLFEEAQDKLGLAANLGNTGRAYDELKDYRTSLEYHQQALKIDAEMDNTRGMCIRFANIGMALYELKEYDNALEYFHKALALGDQMQNKMLYASALVNIGLVLIACHDYTNALDYNFKALKILQEIDHKVQVAVAMQNIGVIYATTGKYEDARDYLERSMIISREIGTSRITLGAYQSLSELYEKTGHYAKALEHYKKAMEVKDSLYNEEKTKEITRREMQYEFDKREAAAKAEQAQKEVSMNLQIAEMEMKALRSQMNPHFIFNALQSIQKFLISHRTEEANTYLLKFAKLMRLVLENSQHTEVPLKKDMEALELYMQLESIRLPYPFTYRFQIDETLNLDDTSIPPLILQPFVENAIWHGLQYKTEPGHINIYINQRANALSVKVEDNGVGRNMNKYKGHGIPREFGMKKESLGVKLTEERLKVLNEIKKINADFKITDLFTKENEAAGTRVELLLPV